jgi:hypothetical protein
MFDDPGGYVNLAFLATKSERKWECDSDFSTNCHEFPSIAFTPIFCAPEMTRFEDHVSFLREHLLPLE